MNLYTCKHFFPNLIILFVLIISIILSIVLLTRKEVRKGIAVLLISLFLLLTHLGTYLDYYYNIYALKDTDKIQIVEGQVTNLKKTGFWEAGYDSFFINDTDFFVSCNPLEPGYHRPSVYGGCLSREGMYVRTSYVEYNGNRYIMAIDEIEGDRGTVLCVNKTS